MRWSALGRVLTSLAFTACSACSEDDATSETKQEVPRLPPITDLNDAEDVVEISLVATDLQKQYLPSGAAHVWGYRDGSKPDSPATVPGPLIEVNEGDRVIVHFRNELPEGTTIHWHGLRVPNKADGTEASQKEVPPGGTYTYEFVARDEGTFWYHPHVRGETQIERGLHGMLVVHGGPSLDVDQERTFVLDDVKLKASGVLSDSTTSLDIMLGRQGNFIVANGTIGGQIRTRAGARERWRIVNVANGRYFNLRLPGHSFRIIGWDGGLLEKPYSLDTLLVTPGERYDVLVEFAEDDAEPLALETTHYDRGHDVPNPGPKPIFTIALDEPAERVLAPLPTTWGDPIALTPGKNAQERVFVLKEQPAEDGLDVVFSINDRAFPDVAPLQVREGETEVWIIDNQTEMDHPFHLHGMFFRVLEIAGWTPAFIGWKDTVNVPMKSTVRFVVEYGEPGMWMYHCHILEHAERGMMGELAIRGRSE